MLHGIAGSTEAVERSLLWGCGAGQRGLPVEGSMLLGLQRMSRVWGGREGILMGVMFVRGWGWEHLAHPPRGQIANSALTCT